MLYVDPEPGEALSALHERADQVGKALAVGVEQWLDAIEQHPGSSAVRQRRFMQAGLWVTAVRGHFVSDWVILWETDGTDVDVRYIGPASFA
jgi:hypothetical protein